MTLSLGEVPLGLALQALHDTAGTRFELRDYGILISGGGGGMAGGGGGSLIELWKSGQPTSPEDPEQESKK